MLHKSLPPKKHFTYTTVLNDLEHSRHSVGPTLVAVFKSHPIQKRKHFSNTLHSYGDQEGVVFIGGKTDTQNNGTE